MKRRKEGTKISRHLFDLPLGTFPTEFDFLTKQFIYFAKFQKHNQKVCSNS